MGLRSYLFKRLKTAQDFSNLTSIKKQLKKAIESFSSENKSNDFFQSSNSSQDFDFENKLDSSIEMNSQEQESNPEVISDNDIQPTKSYIKNNALNNIDENFVQNEFQINNEFKSLELKVINIIVREGTIVQKTFLSKDGREIIKYFN